MSTSCRRIFVKCLEMCTNAQSLLFNAFAGINFPIRWLQPIDIGLGFGAASHLTGEFPTVSWARGRPQLMDGSDVAASEIWWSLPVRWGCGAFCSMPRDICAQDFVFPSCCDGSCTSITTVPADLNTSIPVTDPILTWSVRTACTLELWEILGSEYSLHEGVELFHPYLIQWQRGIYQFSTFLVYAASSEANQRFVVSLWVVATIRHELVALFAAFSAQSMSIARACSEYFRMMLSWCSVSCSNESPRACGIFRCFVCVRNVNWPLSRSICSSSPAVLGVSTEFSISYHWQIRLKIHHQLLANMVLMRGFLLSDVPWKWKLLPPFLSCPSDNGPAGNIGWEAWHLNLSTTCNATVSHFPWGSLEFPFHHEFSDLGSTKHQSRGLNLVANATTSLGLCKHVSVSPFFVQSKSLNIHMNMIVSLEDPGVRPKCFWICLLSASQMNCTSLAAKLNFSTCPCSFHTSSHFVAQLLDGSGFETPTHDEESENTWTFILIIFAAGSHSNEILDQRNMFQSCNTCTLCASLRSISVFTCRCTDCIKSCVHGKLLSIAILLKSSQSFLSQRWSWQAVAHKFAPDRNVEILNIVRIFTRSCTYTVQYLTLRLETLCRIVELPMCIFLHHCSSGDEVSLHQCYTDRSWLSVTRNLMLLQSLPVARRLMMLQSPLWWIV